MRPLICLPVCVVIVICACNVFSSGNRTGHLCSQCPPGYSETLGSLSCRRDSECKDGPLFVIGTLIVGTAFACLLFFRNIHSDGFADSIVYFYQLLPGFLVGKQTLGGLWIYVADFADLRLPVGTSSTLCPFPGMTLLQKNLIGLAAPVVIIFPLLVLFIIAYAVRACRSQQQPRDVVARMASALLDTVLFSFSSVVTAISIVLNCVPLGGFEGRRFIFEAAYIECYQPWQFVFFLLLGLSIALPAALAIITVRLRRTEELHSASSGEVGSERPLSTFSANKLRASVGGTIFASLSGPYRRGVVWWESVLLLQRIVVVLTTTFVNAIALRLMLLLIFTMMMLAAHTALRPYRLVRSQRMQGAVLLLLMTAAALNVPQATLESNASPAASDMNQMITALNIVLSVLVVFPAVCLVLFAAYQQFHKRCKRAKLAIQAPLLSAAERNRQD